ncbi:hypothetical protein O3M35_006502 [Rhynocoris fuscipes]|uniref:Uncharacterized protein n=1 Tax=Rhynocoris fuscipes TaxID=488301 RepID=A0AAW1DEA9_9HEMI
MIASSSGIKFVIRTYEEREESRLQNENGCNEAIDKKNKIEERPKHKRQAAPPPPPPFPVGMVVTEEKPAQKKTNTPLQSTKKQPAPPPPPPSPPYCPTPDYDTASLASQMTSDDNNKNGGESDTIKRRGTVAQAQVQKSDIVEMQSLESFKLTDPAKVKPKPPNTYFTQNSSSNQSDTSNGTASTVPIKDNKSKPIVTIREYPAGKERKNPTKFDFLQNISSTQTVDDDKQPIASRLQNELSQTLQRATPTLTKNEIECANKLKNGQVTKNGAGTVVTINISSQSQNCCSKNDLGKQPFYLFPNGKANAIENKKINDLMLQSSVNNNNNNNNNKSYVGNGKARSPLDNSTKNSVTFNFNNKTQETRSVNMVQPNGILKNGNNISHVQIPQQKSIKFGGM